jgi:hypothetical protein
MDNFTNSCVTNSLQRRTLTQGVGHCIWAKLTHHFVFKQGLIIMLHFNSLNSKCLNNFSEKTKLVLVYNTAGFTYKLTCLLWWVTAWHPVWHFPYVSVWEVAFHLRCYYLIVVYYSFHLCVLCTLPLSRHFSAPPPPTLKVHHLTLYRILPCEMLEDAMQNFIHCKA